MLNPSEIIEEIRDQIPFDQAVFEKSYSGLNVRWLVSYTSITSKNGVAVVECTFNPNITIFFNQRISLLPQFRNIKKGSEIIINGEIERVKDHLIYLTNCTVSYLGNKYSNNIKDLAYQIIVIK
jgi:hypothetical protein